MRRFLLLSLFVLSVVVALTHSRATVTPAKVLNYLTKYGYLSRGDQRIGTIRSERQFHIAVRKLQRFTGLNETGDPLDPLTLELVTKPRCGFPDIGRAAYFRRKKRYALQGTRWFKKDLKYKIARYTSDLTKKQVDDTIQSAIDKWNKVSSLRFTKVTSGPADIEIRFEKYDIHGDGYPFDGPGGELAHAFFPGNNAGIFGDVHFDDAEKFTVNTPSVGSGVDLSWVTLHELGHSLGLDHSSNSHAIMFPIYRGYLPGLQLHRDDILGIQQLYGKPTINRVTPTPHANPTQATGAPNQCNTALDAMVMTADKTTYAFKGAYFWPIGDQGVFTGALKISQFWSGLEDDIDAGYTRQTDGLTFFFKGSKYWTYANRTLVQGPLPMSALNLPAAVHNMDAALEWGANGELYILKGNQFWRYNSQRNSTDPGYPKIITSVLPGLPSDVDAALQWKNGKTYFLKGAQYYALDDAKVRIASGYPKSISTYWMGCSPAGLIGGNIAPKYSSASSLLTSVSLGIVSLILIKLGFY